ncbi:MAG: ACT domain-containing protein [Clostridiales bacterium]|nr:ACT domain-containing protein [Clostridiales bacterium]
MKAVITVVGKDVVGIIAAVSNELVKYNVNIVDISQSVFDDIFAMVMMVDISGCTIPFTSFVDELNSLGESRGLKIHTMHEDIFNSMHKI